MRKYVLLASVAVLLVTASCRSHYEITGVERTRIVIDERYDRNPDEAAARFLAPYKQQVDSVMGPVVGEVAENMAAARPESTLSNLISDVLMWAAKDYDEHPVFAVQNMGGLRASLAKGPVTFGDVLAVAPFENKICFLTLTGQKVLELFQQIAGRGGEGVSHGVELVISKDNKLLSARINGQEVDPTATYRVSTIDYLAQGNDQLTAFQSGTDLNSPQEERNNTRFIIVNYFKEKQALGEPVTAQLEGRIRIR